MISRWTEKVSGMGTSLVVPVVKTLSSQCKGAWVRSLVEELRSCVLHNVAYNTK